MAMMVEVCLVRALSASASTLGPKDDFYADDAQQLAATVSPAELNALFALYNATNGDFWLFKPELTAGPVWDFTYTHSHPDPLLLPI